jgi:hypothetical protein
MIRSARCGARGDKRDDKRGDKRGMKNEQMAIIIALPCLP